MSLLSTLNRFTPSANVFIVKFEKLNARWDENDNNKDDNSHDQDVDRTDFTVNLIYFF